MAMRETERSLRWFFLLAGGITVVTALSALGDMTEIPHALATKLVALPAWYSAIAHLVLGVGFVLAGLRLKQALLTGAGWIQRLILISAVALIVEIILQYSIWGIQLDGAYQQGALVGGVIGIGIRFAVIVYLYASVRRLSAEARVRTAGTAFE